MTIQGAIPRARVAGWESIAAVLATIAVVLTVEWLPKLGVPVKAVAGLVAALCALTIPAALRVARAHAGPGSLIGWLVVSLGSAAAFPLLAGSQPRNEVLLGTVGPIVLGWVLILWLWGDDETAGEGAAMQRGEPPNWALPLTLVLSFAVLTLVHALAVGSRAIVSDEAVYLLQSEWFWSAEYGWKLPPELVPHFQMRKLGFTPSGALYGMYTPGWPAVLALFDAVGLRWWSSIVLGTGSVYVTYRLGALLYNRWAGLLAAALLSVHPWFLVWHAGYMAHPATMLSVLLAALWLLQGETLRGWSRTWRWLGVGVALGVAVTTRSLTGVTIGASLALWIVVRGRLPWGDLVRCAITVLIGAIPLAAWFFHYNLVTNGEALRLSYQAIHGSGYDLGFGLRGFVTYDDALRPLAGTVNFTPRDAVEHLLARIAGVNFSFLPYALTVPFIALVYHVAKPSWKVVACFTILPVAYFFYWGTDVRFYSEMLPFLLAWAAAALVAMARDNPRRATRFVSALAVAIVALNVPGRWSRIALDEPWDRTAYTTSASRFALFERLDALERERGKLLVIVRERVPRLDVLLDRLYRYNAEGLDAPILVVRDRGEQNQLVLRRFADRTAVLVTDRGPETESSLEVLSR